MRRHDSPQHVFPVSRLHWPTWKNDLSVLARRQVKFNVCPPAGSASEMPKVVDWACSLGLFFPSALTIYVASPFYPAYGGLVLGRQRRCCLFGDFSIPLLFSLQSQEQVPEII